jgi:hypothetical protein
VNDEENMTVDRNPDLSSDCRGLTSLVAGDVLALLRVAFWIIGGPCNLDFAVRQAAIIAFMVLARVGIKPLARMRLRPPGKTSQVYETEWWFEAGKGFFTVKDRFALRRHLAPDELTFAVQRYLARRPEGSCDHLFVTREGLPLEASSYSLTAKSAADGLELGRPLPTLLKEFCERRIKSHPVKEAVAYCLARKFKGRRPAVDCETALEVLTHSDPFGGNLRRAMEDDEYALELLREDPELRTRLPSVARVSSTTSGQNLRPRLSAEDHPWIAELLAIQRPDRRSDWRDEREKLFVQYYPKMKPLLESFELTHVQAREFFGYSRGAWRIRLLKEVYGDDWWAQAEPAYPGSRRALAMREAGGGGE